MPRFKLNRWWALIPMLVLAFAFTGLVVSADYAHADAVIDAPDDQGGGANPGTGYGDPDVPTGTSKGAMLRGFDHRLPLGSGLAAGDGSTLDDIWMWRLQAAMQLLRGRIFHL